jgi:uncharacterized protein (TIGR03435 family)
MKGRTMLVTRTLRLVATLLAIAVPASLQGTAQQAPAPSPDPKVPLHFEVATVKPNKSGKPGGSMRREPGGRITAVNMPLQQLITFAYQISPMQLVGGPGWIGTERFDIVAKLEGDPAPVPAWLGPDHAMLAMQTLLAERFRLEVHRESREFDVFALVMPRAGGSPGPALKRSTQDCSPEAVKAMAGRGGPPPGPKSPVLCAARMLPGRLQLGGMPMSTVTGPLGALTGRIVVDRSGLQGNWDFDLTFAPEPGRGVVGDIPPPDPNGPSIFTAVQEQLGLRLDSTRAPVDVLVVDSVEPPTPD